MRLEYTFKAGATGATGTKMSGLDHIAKGLRFTLGELLLQTHRGDAVERGALERVDELGPTLLVRVPVVVVGVAGSLVAPAAPLHAVPPAPPAPASLAPPITLGSSLAAPPEVAPPTVPARRACEPTWRLHVSKYFCKQNHTPGPGKTGGFLGLTRNYHHLNIFTSRTASSKHNDCKKHRCPDASARNMESQEAKTKRTASNRHGFLHPRHWEQRQGSFAIWIILSPKSSGTCFKLWTVFQVLDLTLGIQQISYMHSHLYDAIRRGL